MYQIFLTLRYLTRKKIVIFPILVVWLCLMMMIIVTSIMGGFVDRVRQTNRELLGDIVISNPTAAGWPYYEELQDYLKKNVPEIEASTPVVHAYGLMNLPNRGANAPVQIVGIDPVGRSKVSKFRENLFQQYKSPMNAVDDFVSFGLPKTSEELQKAATDAFEHANQAIDAAEEPYLKARMGLVESPPLNAKSLFAIVPVVLFTGLLLLGAQKKRSFKLLVSAIVILVVGGTTITLIYFWPRIRPHDFRFTEDAYQQAKVNVDRANRTYRFSIDLAPHQKWNSRQELVDALVPRQPTFTVPPEAAARYDTPAAVPKNGCIVGVQVGLFPRDRRGNFDRTHRFDFEKAIITVVPVTSKGGLNLGSAQSEVFALVDDSYTGVYDVDSTYVYAPLEVVQSMAFMRPDPSISPDDKQNWFPPRCNEVLIKLKNSNDPAGLEALSNRIQNTVDEFFEKRTLERFAPLQVETWNQRQAKYLNAVENEKVMQIFILSLMSLVVLVVIYLIFHMIVRDKTRDIGIIKAIGGSELGICTIFLFYGLVIGAVGGALGVISGVAFVTHTNQIHEAIFQLTGITIWDRSVYLFDRIPDTYNAFEVARYYAVSMLAGVLGALIPAMFAARLDAAKAVRYE